MNCEYRWTSKHDVKGWTRLKNEYIGMNETMKLMYRNERMM